MTTVTRRKPQPTADDKFVASSLQFIVWARKNTRALVLGIGAVLILAAGVYYYIDYRSRIEEAASAQIQTIRFDLGVGNVSQTVESLQTYIARFGSTRYSTEARVLLAHALLIENRAAEAIAPAQEAAAKLGSDPLAARAAFLMAAAYEQVGDTSSAIQVYEEIGNRASLLPERVRGYDGAAVLLGAQGSKARALELYRQIIELTPEDSPRRAFYEMQAAEVAAEPIPRISTP